jgi:hypothetical protein
MVGRHIIFFNQINNRGFHASGCSPAPNSRLVLFTPPIVLVLRELLRPLSQLESHRSVFARGKIHAMFLRALAGNRPSNFVDVQNLACPSQTDIGRLQPPDRSKCHDPSNNAGRASTRQPPAQRDRSADNAIIKPLHQPASFRAVFPCFPTTTHSNRRPRFWQVAIRLGLGRSARQLVYRKGG